MAQRGRALGSLYQQSGAELQFDDGSAQGLGVGKKIRFHRNFLPPPGLLEVMITKLPGFPPTGRVNEEGGRNDLDRPLFAPLPANTRVVIRMEQGCKAAKLPARICFFPRSLPPQVVG